MDRQLTDAQFDRLVRWVARVCLETERGLRSAEQLRDVMTESAWGRWQRGRGRGGLPPGPVDEADIATPHVCRLATDHVIASAAVRAAGPQWAALTLELSADPRGRWRVMDLHLLRSRRHYRHGGGDPAEGSLVDRIRFAERDRRLAARGAAAATKRAVGARPGDRDAVTVGTAGAWRSILDGLDRELADLRSQAQLRARIPPSPHR